jgi:flagellar basal-body rod modification protein FlgD
MASIGNSLSSISTNPTTSASAASTASSSNANDPTAALGNEGTFLQLLVAQLKNQDPSQPQDGTQFVSQLAQFSSLEQSIGMKSDLDTIKADYAATPGTTSGTNGTTAA